MKTIKDAVIDHNGKWLGESEGSKLYRWNNLWIFSSKVYPDYKLICDQQEFEAEAKQLGYLNALIQEQSLTHIEEGLTHSWYDYENQKALRLPDVGIECEYLTGSIWQPCYIKCHVENDGLKTAIFQGVNHWGGISSDRFRPLDHATRKAELEKNKFIQAADAAFKETGFDRLADFGVLFDAGFRLPEQSK